MEPLQRKYVLCCLFFILSLILTERVLTLQEMHRYFIRGLHTRACKYNLSALETYFECEGVKPTNLNFT